MNISRAKAAIFAACMTAALCQSVPTLAGELYLVNTSGDSMCRVDIMSGMNAPNSGQQDQASNVSDQGRLGPYTDKVCYKRPNNPTDCSSGMTASWTCCTRTISGTEDCSLH